MQESLSCIDLSRVDVYYPEMVKLFEVVLSSALTRYRIFVINTFRGQVTPKRIFALKFQIPFSYDQFTFYRMYNSKKVKQNILYILRNGAQ